jgi:uncharacterized protein YciI
VKHAAVAARREAVDNPGVAAPYFVAFLETKYASLEDARRLAPDALATHVSRSQQWHAEGRLLMAGAFLDRPEEPVSTMAVLRTREDAEEFVAGDPFVLLGMVARSDVRRWADMLGT